MIDRRRFLQVGSAGVLATAVGGTSSFLEPASTASFRPHVAMVDTRFPESVRFGAELSRNGVALHETRGDVTALWYVHLHPLWKQRPAAIAGLSGYGPMFCLERLAWDHGMRMIFRGEHRPLPHNAVEHRLAAVPARNAVLAPLAHDWPKDLAARVLALDPSLPTSGLAEQRSITAARSAKRTTNETLYSWVIAPRASA